MTSLAAYCTMRLTSTQTIYPLLPDALSNMIWSYETIFFVCEKTFLRYCAASSPAWPRWRWTLTGDFTGLSARNGNWVRL